jgi:hypothetical protein
VRFDVPNWALNPGRNLLLLFGPSPPAPCALNRLILIERGAGLCSPHSFFGSNKSQPSILLATPCFGGPMNSSATTPRVAASHIQYFT